MAGCKSSLTGDDFYGQYDAQVHVLALSNVFSNCYSNLKEVGRRVIAAMRRLGEVSLGPLNEGLGVGRLVPLDKG